MAITFKHIQRIASAAATYGSILQVGDRLDTVFQKLQSLLVTRSVRTILTAAVSGGSSSTEDINVLSLTISPDTTFAGACYRITLNGTIAIAKPLLISTTVNIWVKVGSTKVAVLTFTSMATRTDTLFSVDFFITVRTIGASGTVYVSGNGTWQQTDTSQLTVFGNGPAATVDNTSNFPITVGFNFSNSNASNNLTAQTGIILQI